MENDTELLQCYNRGCGQKYDSNKNSDDACRHHPGLPFFHDAYKGWSCCNKKCTDFTEFLNIKGCTLSCHSNIKPLEPEKPSANEVLATEIVEVKPMVQAQLKRPSVDTPLITLKPEIAPSLKQQLQNDLIQHKKKITENVSEIAVDTPCKNRGCNISYEGPATDEKTCIYHSGSPIFHEGLKYWSCCQKKTTDFNVFLNQVGCQKGKHVWINEDVDERVVDCRWDWHQTGSHVVVSIYAKQYCPNTSIVQLNPIRLFINLVFPQQDNATFTLDMELEGIVDVKASQASMYGTKVEIKLKKAQPGSWRKIEIPKVPQERPSKSEESINVENITPYIESVDLSDL